MKNWQLRDMTYDEINIHLKEVEEEIFNLRMQKAVKQIPNPKKSSVLRRERAKCLTMLKEHESGIRTLKGSE